MSEAEQPEVPSVDNFPPAEPNPRLDKAIKRCNEELFGPKAGILVDDPQLVIKLMGERISTMERKRDRSRRLHEENAQYRKQREAVEAMGAEMQSQMAAAIEPAQRRANACAVVLESFLREQNELCKTIAALNVDSDETERKIAGLETERQRQDQHFDALKERVEQRKSLVRGEMRRVALLERKLNKKRAKEANALAVVDDMKAQNAELKEKREALRARCEAAVANTDESRKKLEEAKRRVDQSKAEQSESAERRAAAEKRLADVETRREEIRLEGVDIERKVAVLNDEILAMQKEKAALEATTAERLEQINREKDDESHRTARGLLNIEERMKRETRNLNCFQQELRGRNAAMVAEIEATQQRIGSAKAGREGARAVNERVAREVADMEARLEALEDSKPPIEVPATPESDEIMPPPGSQRRNIVLAPETESETPSSLDLSVEVIDVPETDDPANDGDVDDVEMVAMPFRRQAGPEEQ